MLLAIPTSADCAPGTRQNYAVWLVEPAKPWCQSKAYGSRNFVVDRAKALTAHGSPGPVGRSGSLQYSSKERPEEFLKGDTCEEMRALERME